MKHLTDHPAADASEFLALVFAECTTFMFEVLLVHNQQYSLNEADCSASKMKFREISLMVPHIHITDLGL
jgi:hypothetical protein